MPPALRLRSLDVFRGATVALMILVNNAGDWGKTWAPLLHAEWHGWTLTDLVFPFFLFIVGAAIPFALPRPHDPATSAERHRKILKRSVLLFLLGLALIWFPYYTVAWERARIFGVLQRIGIVYCVAALAWLHLRTRARAVLSIALLAGYWAAMKLIPVPGFGAGDLSPEGNLAFHVDHLILGPHIWRYSPGPGDPEGILSTMPAIVSALAGLFAGEYLRSKTGTTAEREAPRTLIHLTLTGALLTILGLATSPLFPINKNLWSPTYVIFTSGLALLALAAFHALLDRGETPKTATWARPFELFGRNAIAAYVGSGVMARTLTVIRLHGAEGEMTLRNWLYGNLYASWLPGYWASFFWALDFVLVWLAVVWLLDRRGLHLRL
jgi:predicted acyltransferase